MVSSTVIDEVLGVKGTFDVRIDAHGVHYRELNDRIRQAVLQGGRRILLTGVYGQRYIGTRLAGLPPVRIEIEGVPGNDLGAFMDGHMLIVHGNAQDGVGNTMHGGEIIVEGRAGDVLGMSMVAGSILVRDDIGYRGALHMKERGHNFPVVIVGGTAQDFLGEYMAGGRVVLMGLGVSKHEMSFIGTGMHAGRIYIRGPFSKRQIGEGAEIQPLKEGDLRFLRDQIHRYEETFGVQRPVKAEQFRKLVPKGKRPYSKLYA